LLQILADFIIALLDVTAVPRSDVGGERTGLVHRAHNAAILGDDSARERHAVSVSHRRQPRSSTGGGVHDARTCLPERETPGLRG